MSELAGDPEDAELRRRLEQFFRWDLAICISSGIGLLGVYLLFRSAALPIITGAIAINSAMLWLARRQSRKGAMAAAFASISVGMASVCATIAIVLPAVFTLVPLLLIWPVVVALPYVAGGALRRLMLFSTLAAALCTALGIYGEWKAPGLVLPGALVKAALLASVPGVFIALYVLLGYNSARLDDVLARTKRANAALRESERQLERKVEERTRELAEARDQALEAMRAKSDFLAKMSHELRTPLNAILGYGRLVQEDAQEAGMNALVPDLERIQTAGKHLLTLINEVLDLSKIEAGRMELSPERFEIAALVAEVEAIARPLLKPGVALEIECPKDAGAMETDLTKLKQTLFNLLANAVKFTEKGQIRLTVTRDAQRVAFDVSDTGIGMTAEQQGRLFQAFSQGDAATPRKYGGTGLGLAISRAFCRLMGGDIKVVSRPNEGSRFTVCVPALSPEPAVERTPLPARAPRPPGPNRVLVIDDDAATRDLLARFFVREGFDVSTARSGKDGLDQAARARPDLILLDVVMPELDGWSVLMALKESPQTRGIPVVLVTMLDQQRKGYALGAAEFLSKPVDFTRLHGIASRYRKVPSRALVVDDDADARAVVRRTLEKEGWEVSEVADGEAALLDLTTHAPDLIVLDLLMPRMDGFELLVKLRERGQPSPPVLVLTAKEIDGNDRARLAGAVHGVLQKGALSADELLSSVRALASRLLPP